ncbi:MAG TPA: DUF2975 domain-containing protein, partial [Chitinophagaceae bacterium]|nr:DUF2975 domain-containing protein [Chitinophagaceae bacterium]
VFWILFIGLCIQTGATLISFFVSLFINREGAADLYLGLNLSELYAFSTWHYVSLVSFLLVLPALKAFIAYLVVKIFMKFNAAQPFSAPLSALISRISHMALGVGVLSLIAQGYARWLAKKGIAVPVDWDSSEFLFLAGIIFIIAQVFKKGIALQTENELTV